MQQPHNHGYLFINLGTPASTQPRDVRAYLNEFLMDPYVISLPWIVRRMLVSAFILPFRPRRSAAAYAKIWTAEGSPLLCHSQALVDQVSRHLDAPTALAMRYGNPSISDALETLASRGTTHVTVVPLYPQYAESTVRTSMEAVEQANAALRQPLLLSYVAPFYDSPAYIEALARSARAHQAETYDHILLSYHGLPEAHLKKADPTHAHCLKDEACCRNPSVAHATCYRHQVYATSLALAAGMNWSAADYSVTFQSRLGRAPWLRPYTDETLSQLPAKGIRKLLVMCPAFLADNLETLEEIAIQGRETFLQAGGELLTVAPCLNDEPQWAQDFAHMLTSNTFKHAAQAP